MTTRGKFIVVEGIDGCGKSTLVSKLRWSIPNVRKFVAPDSMDLGHTIREILKEGPISARQMAVLFAADRVIQARGILTALEKGDNVLCDRWSLSTWAYQKPYLTESDLPFLRDLCEIDGLKPDLTLLLDLPPETAQERLAKRDENRDSFERNMTLQRSVRLTYLALADSESPLAAASNIRKIDAEQSPVNVYQQALSVLGTELGF